MSKTLTQKKHICSQVENILNTYNTCLFLEHQTITGDEFSMVRKTLKQNNSQIVCVKKNLLKRILKDDFKSLADQSGSLMMIYSNDPLVSINTLKKTIRKIKGFNFQNSIIENKVLSVKSIEALSKYPDKNTLLSVTLSYIKIGTFQLIDVLEQIKDKKS